MRTIPLLALITTCAGILVGCTDPIDTPEPGFFLEFRNKASSPVDLTILRSSGTTPYLSVDLPKEGFSRLSGLREFPFTNRDTVKLRFRQLADTTCLSFSGRIGDSASDPRLESSWVLIDSGYTFAILDSLAQHAGTCP